MRPGQRSTGNFVQAEITTTFFVLIGIFFPSVTGELCERGREREREREGGRERGREEGEGEKEGGRERGKERGREGASMCRCLMKIGGSVHYSVLVLSQWENILLGVLLVFLWTCELWNC